MDDTSFLVQELYIKELIKKADSTHVLVRLLGPPGVYLRTLEDLENDPGLWEEILNYEFPQRHEEMARGIQPRRRPGLVSEPWWQPRKSIECNVKNRRGAFAGTEMITKAFEELGIGERKGRTITAAFEGLEIY